MMVLLNKSLFFGTEEKYLLSFMLSKKNGGGICTQRCHQ